MHPVKMCSQVSPCFSPRARLCCENLKIQDLWLLLQLLFHISKGF